MSELELEGEDSLDGVEQELLRGPGAPLASDEARVDRAAAVLVVQRFRARERQRRAVIAAGSALSIAAAAALVVGLNRPGAPPAEALASRVPQSPLVVESGSVVMAGGERATQGKPVAAASLATLAPSTCLRAGSSVRLCSKAGAKLELPSLGGAWQVALAEGAVTVELEAMPAGFTLSTIHGSARVEGTLFSMELDASRAFTTVMVERGSVRVTAARTGEKMLLGAGERVRFGAGIELAEGESAPADSAATAPHEVAPAAPAGAAAAAPSVAKGKSASDLLEEARQERGAGRYAQAAQLYRKLVQQHPASAEARASLVSLGQLELGQLGQPEAALRSFRAYLAGPGQLRQEAEHGVIQSLQRLGRKAEERRAIEAFLARYPKSTQAGALSQRLKQL